MSMSSLRTAIQTKLYELAKTGRFYRVRYGSDHKPLVIDPDAAELRVPPASIAVNETSAAFEPDELFGRDVRQRRTSWVFELRLGFDHEVTVAFFEEDVAESAPRIPKTEHHTYALLRVVDAEYTHPVREGSGGGSTVVLQFEAQIGR